MEVKTLCKNCGKYYRYDDDKGNLLVEGCKLDIPLFHPRKAIVCSSYLEKGKKYDN